MSQAIAIPFTNQYCRACYVADVACRFIPMFRDKFDFSVLSDYDALVDLAYKAAEAYTGRVEKEVVAAQKADTEAKSKTATKEANQ